MSLEPRDFPGFFEALWGYGAFPWQARLATEVGTSGWPRALDLPTASGKTAAIDIALFQLALEADKGPARRAPVRIAFVVDRRLVVDSAFDRGRWIARNMALAEDGILKIVADRLRELGGGEPLRVVRLRGGMPREPDWVHSPAQPTVVISTVDQVGSRLLFRGYGVSNTMRPVHAGLLGSDVLYLLDEAHLSQPFVETLGWVERYRKEPWAERAVGPFGVVHLSATHAPGGPEPVRLQEPDRAHPMLGPRLRARKHTRIERLEAKLDETERLARGFADHAARLARNDGVKVIAVVANRVALARAVFQALTQPTKDGGEKALPRARALAPCSDQAGGDDGPGADAVLLIGRTRPLDRDRLLDRVLPCMRAGRSAKPAARPLFVVATQCIEAGADLDFDALVTQIAPLDSLRQRFGRLDRLGKRGENRAIIVAGADEIGSNSQDPIYGGAIAATWEWLDPPTKGKRGGKQRSIDFGIDAMDGRLAANGLDPKLLAPRAHAPVMLPAYVDAFAQTSPAPGADPDVALFLHGPKTAADVQIVWRADLDPNEIGRPRAGSTVSACPPSSLEAVSVPIGAARRWLQETAPAEIADVEGTRGPERDPGREGRWALRWRGPDDSRPIRPHELWPGDLVVVPSSYGGCDAYGWDPSARHEVRDLGFEANLRHRRRLILRLDEAVVRNAYPDDPEASGRLWRRISECIEQWHDDPATLASELAALDDLPETWRRAVEGLERQNLRPILDLRDPDHPERGGVLWLHRGLDEEEVQNILDVEALRDAGGDEPSTEDEVGSTAGDQKIRLQDHCGQVADIARGFAKSAGLAAEHVRDITLAACLHDIGKAEDRFQIYLRGGDEVAWEADRTPLAKSGRRFSRPELDAARRRAGLPKGARHECWSVELAAHLRRLEDADDPDLVLWLIGTHHGHGRPFFPPVEYPAAGEALVLPCCGKDLRARVEVPLWRLDSGWIERFERLKRRYGPWELARMEAILRLGDHRASERPEPPAGGRDQPGAVT